MKYIRTKDGIWELESTYEHLGKTYYGIKRRISTFTEEEIIKQADTIEALCDEFVGIDSQGHYIIHNDQFLDGARIIPLENVKYYGAIWTEKGLIYVAKMNESGELVLL